MAYDELLADRIRCFFSDKEVSFLDKKMMGGLCFMVDEKMACGIHIDNKLDDSLLMARIGEDATEQALDHPHCMPMDFTGRPMKGFVFIESMGFESDHDLHHWLQLCLDFNPLAKKSAKRTKKKKK